MSIKFFFNKKIRLNKLYIDFKIWNGSEIWYVSSSFDLHAATDTFFLLHRLDTFLWAIFWAIIDNLFAVRNRDFDFESRIDLQFLNWSKNWMWFVWLVTSSSTSVFLLFPAEVLHTGIYLSASIDFLVSRNALTPMIKNSLTFS